MAPQPKMRLALEGLPRRSAVLSRGPLGAGHPMPIPPAWKQFVFSVDDLPAEGLQQLRFRIDLNGGASVSIDDVQMFDLVFNGFGKDPVEQDHRPRRFSIEPKSTGRLPIRIGRLLAAVLESQRAAAAARRRDSATRRNPAARKIGLQTGRRRSRQRSVQALIGISGSWVRQNSDAQAWPCAHDSSFSPGRPFHLPPAEQVQMQMIDRLAAVGPAIGDDAIAVVELELPREIARD